MRVHAKHKSFLPIAGWLLSVLALPALLTTLVFTARRLSAAPAIPEQTIMALEAPSLEATTITIGSGTINLGDQLTVPISLSIPAPNLLVAITIRVEYDPDIVDFVSCETNSGDFTVALCNQDDGDGIPPDSVAFTAISVTGVNGDLILGEIAFLGQSAGTTALHLIAEAFDDGSGEPPILIDGSITVLGSMPVPSTVGLGSGEVLVGQLFTVPVTVSVPITNALVALTIRVEYDPTVVGFVACAPNNLDFDANFCNNDDNNGVPPDSVTFAAISVIGVNGELLIGTITFIGLTPGETSLTLIVELFEDGSGLPPVMVDGALTVVAGPAPPSLLAVGSGSMVVGELVTIPLTVSVPLTNALTAMTIRVEYDPTFVDATGCRANNAPFTSSDCNLIDDDGEPPDAVAFTALSTTGVNGVIALGDVTFAGVEPGASDLGLVVEVFEDGSGLSPLTIDGYLEVTPGISVPSTLGVGSGAMEVGQLFTVPVTVSVPISNSLTALTIRVEYNPTIVDFVTCTPNNVDFDANLCNNDDGNGVPPDSVAFAAISVTGVNGELLIGAITFVGLVEGQTELALAVQVFEDGSGLPPLTHNGTLVVTAGAEVPSTLTMGSGSVGVGEWITIPLTVSVPSSNALTDMTIGVYYDPAVADAVSCHDNGIPFNNSLCEVHGSGDDPYVLFSATSEAGVNGEIPLGDITFAGAAPGSSALPVITFVFEDGSDLMPLTVGGQLDVFAGQPPTPSTLSVGSGSVSIGAQITVPVTASVPLTNSLSALTIRVQYDPTVADFVNCSTNSADFDLSLCNNDDDDGIPPDSVAFSALSVAGVNGELLIGSIAFEAVAVGETDLALVVDVFEDGSGLPPNTIDGALTVVEGVTANFTGSPRSGVAPLPVTFTNLSTGSFEGCEWDFGDGGSSNVCNNPSHEYTVAGIYDISLTISGPGGTDTKVRADYITVYEPVSADFSGSPRSGSAPLTVAFTNLSTGEFVTCVWDFGDGESRNECDDPGHEYMTAGDYDVRLTVSGPGGSDSKVRAAYVTVESESRLYLPIMLGTGNGQSSSGRQSYTFPELWDHRERQTSAGSWNRRAIRVNRGG